jgi:hypothetical protein
MHSHICPRCNGRFEHERFNVQLPSVTLQSIARALHRFYGACNPCIQKFMAAEVMQDGNVSRLLAIETRSLSSTEGRTHV